MDRKSRIKYSKSNQECSEYEPIQTINNALELNSDAEDEAGCDSCTHYNQSQCNIYKRKTT